MEKLNKKFIKDIPDEELLRFYGDEILSFLDYEKYDLSKEQLKLQMKAAASNFIDHLVYCLKK